MSIIDININDIPPYDGCRLAFWWAIVAAIRNKQQQAQAEEEQKRQADAAQGPKPFTGFNGQASTAPNKQQSAIDQVFSAVSSATNKGGSN